MGALHSGRSSPRCTCGFCRGQWLETSRSCSCNPVHVHSQDLLDSREVLVYLRGYLKEFVVSFRALIVDRIWCSPADRAACLQFSSGVTRRHCTPCSGFGKRLAPFKRRPQVSSPATGARRGSLPYPPRRFGATAWMCLARTRRPACSAETRPALQQSLGPALCHLIAPALVRKCHLLWSGVDMCSPHSSERPRLGIESRS